MDKSELPEEITALITAAEAGDAEAQFKLGWKYQEGQDVEQSDPKAVEWYLKAAEQGYSLAQSELGVMYRRGRGVEQDDNKAVAWIRKAADQGDAKAQCNLGMAYRLGISVEQNDSEAVIWYRKAAAQEYLPAQNNLAWMYSIGRGVDKDHHEAVSLYRKAAEQGHHHAQFNLGLMYMNGSGVDKDYGQALELFKKAGTTTDPDLHFKAIEYQDQAERNIISPKITSIRSKILSTLKVNNKTTPTITHYTSLAVGSELLLKESPLRLGHINSLNDPNEGKLLWRYLEHVPEEGKPVFVGCFLPDEDSLNMWRFYSKDHHKDDACGCAITFRTDNFFDFVLLKNEQKNEDASTFLNTGVSPQESATFYRVIYIDDEMNIHGDDANGAIKKSLVELKKEVKKFLENITDDSQHQDISRLLGPLPYLLKDADYVAEHELRIIIAHLEYGAKEIQYLEPMLENGTPQTAPKLYLELHRAKHLDPVKHVTLGPKAPHQDMMAPYWHHKLASDFREQLEGKPDFYIRSSKCAYK